MSAHLQFTGLQVCRVRCPDGKDRHILANVQPVNEGAGYQYSDPVTGEIVGFTGANHARENISPITDWVK